MKRKAPIVVLNPDASHNKRAVLQERRARKLKSDKKKADLAAIHGVQSGSGLGSFNPGAAAAASGGGQEGLTAGATLPGAGKKRKGDAASGKAASGKAPKKQTAAAGGGGHSSDEGDGSGHDERQGEVGSKRKRKTKEYVPRVGSANYVSPSPSGNGEQR